MLEKYSWYIKENLNCRNDLVVFVISRTTYRKDLIGLTRGPIHHLPMFHTAPSDVFFTKLILHLIISKLILHLCRVSGASNLSLEETDFFKYETIKSKMLLMENYILSLSITITMNILNWQMQKCIRAKYISSYLVFYTRQTE